MTQIQDPVKKITKLFSNYCDNLITKIKDPQCTINLQMKQCSQQVTLFFDEAPNNTRVQFAYNIQKQIRNYLKISVFDRLHQLLSTQQSDQYQFINQISDIWQNYSRFTYALNFVLHRTANIFNDFHRFSKSYQQIFLQEQKKDGIDLSYRNQITPIPTMAINQLKQFLKINNMFKSLLNKFIQYFSAAIKKQRQGINIQREELNLVLQFFQSTCYDYDCDVERIEGKLRIVKKANIYAPINRKSTANIFFTISFKTKLLQDCSLFYRQWIDNKALSMNSAQQLKQILNFLQQQQSRAKYYIHDPINEKQYIDTVEKNVIQYRFEERISKIYGMKYFLSNFQIGKSDMVEQIHDLWNVYKRVYHNQSQSKLILKTYQNYLKQQATTISKLTQKPPQFIQSIIKLNKKNIALVAMLGKTLDLDRLRKQILEDTLLAKFSTKSNIKEYFGAKHWAGYLNMKLRNKYIKAEKYGESQVDLMNVFKLLRLTSFAIGQHCKLLNARLLDDLDMSLNTQYSNALQLQQKIVQQIKKQTSQNDIKSIQNCLKDIRNSFDQRSKQKQALTTYNYFNQLIKKSGNHWLDTTSYDIQPPLILRSCINQLRQQFQSNNFAFQFQNGTSTFMGTFGKDIHKFQFKNIYMIVLLTIDQLPNKKLFYTDLIQYIKPIGQQRTHNQFIKILIQLIKFGLLLTNKSTDQTDIAHIWNWLPADYLQLNRNFTPDKKLPYYKTVNLTSLPQYVKKAFQIKLNILEQEEKNMEKDRKIRVQSKCVQLLKFAQTNQSGKGVITFQEILNQLMKSNRQDNVNTMYLKEVLEELLNRGYCERVEDKRNVFRYIS